MTQTITREQFIAAIEAGIAGAERHEWPLTSAEVAALAPVARRAVRVHTNFEGCPATLAGLYNENDHHTDDRRMRCFCFTAEYDKYLFGGAKPLLDLDGDDFWFEVTE